MRQPRLDADETIEGSSLTIYVSYTSPSALESNALSPPSPEPIKMEDMYVLCLLEEVDPLGTCPFSRLRLMMIGKHRYLPFLVATHLLRLVSPQVTARR